MSVRIVEVGPRDGLQNIRNNVPTPVKLELINRLEQTGLRIIELTSVVSPKAIPQLADCQTVLSSTPVQKLLTEKTHLRLPVLIPNTKGLDIALKYGVKEAAVFISATEGFSKANINCTVQQGIDRARAVATKARSAGVVVRGYVSCIFADPYDGPTPPSAVYRCVKELLDMGCYEVSLGDTLGVGTPYQVRALIEYLVRNGVPLNQLAGHFHDTYGQALANAWEAYNCGIRTFDSSVAGLGGCPFAPGAKGNVASEDLVYMFQNAGIDTGVDLLKVVETGHWISQQLGKANDSRAGTALATKHCRPSRGNSESAKPPKLEWTLERETENLLIYRSGVNLKMVLNRPKNGNALTMPMISQLIEAFKTASADPSISRIAITANGKFFCTGMDLAKNSTSVGQGGSSSSAMFERLTTLLELIDNSPKVTIAAISGPTFGGGIGLAFACDIRISVKTAAFTLSEVKLGLCPATISKYVAREWGTAFTREAMLSARPVGANELKALGAIAEVADNVDGLLSQLDGLLTRLRSSSPAGSRMAKELVRLSWAHAGGETQARGIQALFEEMMRPGSEGAYGVQQFQQRRPVDWDAYIRETQKAKL